MSGMHERTHALLQRTDSRSLADRKHSVQVRIAEIREMLRAAEACDAELATEIEMQEHARERAAAVSRG